MRPVYCAAGNALAAIHAALTRFQAPFKTVFIANSGSDGDAQEVDGIQQSVIAQLLVEAGCLYFMATGPEARSWQDAVNLANLQAWDFGKIPDDKLIICTHHGNESLKDVFWYCKHTAMHPCAPLDEVCIMQTGDALPEARVMADFLAT